jgi:lipoprotein-releasing system permease protein
MLKLFLWLRYLHKKKIVFLSITAVAVSVALLIVVASLFTGFIKVFEQASVDAVGDVVIAPPAAISNYDKLIQNLEQTSQVQAATAVIWGNGLLLLGKGNVRIVEIMGMEPQRRSKVTDFDQFLLSNKYPSAAQAKKAADSTGGVHGYVGIGLLTKPDDKTDEYNAAEAQKMLGERVTLTTGAASSSSQGSSITDFKRQVLRFTISDIVETGYYQLDNDVIYLPIEQLSNIMYPDQNMPVAQQIQIRLAKGTDTQAAIAVIEGVWRNFVDDYYNSNENLKYNTSIATPLQRLSMIIAAYQQQMNVLLVIFGVVSFGVVILIFCIFSLIVRLKRKDIAVIKSCGTTSSSVAWIFVGFGACVGIAGSCIGVILGYIITKNINTIEQWIRIVFGLKLWKSSVYLFTKIPNQVDWSMTLQIVLFAIAAAAVGAVIPAIIAAGTKPVEILRYE